MQQSECALERVISKSLEQRKHKQNRYVDLYKIQQAKMVRTFPEVLSISHLMHNVFGDDNLALFNANILAFSHTEKMISDGLIPGSIKDHVIALPQHLSEYALADAMLHIASSNHIALDDTSITTSGFSYRINNNKEEAIATTYGYGFNELFINYLLSEKMDISNHQGHVVTPLFNKLNKLLDGALTYNFFEGNPLILKRILITQLGATETAALYSQLDELYIAFMNKSNIRIDTITTNLERLVDAAIKQVPTKSRQLVV